MHLFSPDELRLFVVQVSISFTTGSLVSSYRLRHCEVEMIAKFTSKNLIGDGLYISSALRKWLFQNHEQYDMIHIFTLNDHITRLYEGMLRDLDLLCAYVTITKELEGKYDFEHTFDVNAAFILSDRKKQHVAISYAELLGVDIGMDVGPHYIPDHGNLSVQDIHDIDQLKGCILVSMFSASCSSRGNPVGPPNKMLPWEKWKPMLKLLREQFPETPIRFLGAPTDMVPNGYAAGIVEAGEYMLGIPLNKLAMIMADAKLLVTVDNGMSHLAASQQCPTFLMYPRCLGTHYILPIGNRNLLSYVHIDPVHVAPAQLRHALDYAIQKLKQRGKQ